MIVAENNIVDFIVEESDKIRLVDVTDTDQDADADSYRRKGDVF